MNINVQGINNSFFGAFSPLSRRGLKSTEEKMERQAQRDNQVAFFEQQKENLKKMECNTIEEIARKLDMFHSYEDQITAAKAAYNSEQMWHILDESREIGEKIAEAVEKMEPKTPEERVEELVEEAMGMDENDGMLEEVLEDAAQMQEELEEELQTELTEEIQGELQEKIQEDLQGGLQEKLQNELRDEDNIEETVYKQEILSEELQTVSDNEKQKVLYQEIDIRL